MGAVQYSYCTNADRRRRSLSQSSALRRQRSGGMWELELELRVPSSRTLVAHVH